MWVSTFSLSIETYLKTNKGRELWFLYLSIEPGWYQPNYSEFLLVDDWRAWDLEWRKTDKIIPSQMVILHPVDPGRTPGDPYSYQEVESPIIKVESVMWWTNTIQASLWSFSLVCAKFKTCNLPSSSLSLSLFFFLVGSIIYAWAIEWLHIWVKSVL